MTTIIIDFEFEKIVSDTRVSLDKKSARDNRYGVPEKLKNIWKGTKKEENGFHYDDSFIHKVIRAKHPTYGTVFYCSAGRVCDILDFITRHRREFKPPKNFNLKDSSVVVIYRKGDKWDATIFTGRSEEKVRIGSRTFITLGSGSDEAAKHMKNGTHSYSSSLALLYSSVVDKYTSSCVIETPLNNFDDIY